METIVTPVTVITLDSTRIVHNIKADLVARYFPPVVRLVQYDQSLPVIAVSLMQNGQAYTLPNGAAANIRVHKPDATYVYNPALGCDSTRNIVYFEVTQVMAAANGDGLAIVEIVVDGDIAGTSLITLHFEENPVPEDAIESSDEWETIYELGERIIASTVTPVSTAAGMTDNNVVYLYTGTESGWNQGHMYYYNGATWVDAGIAVTDKTLTVEGMSADAKTVGDRLTTLDSDVANLKASDTTQNADISSLKEDFSGLQDDAFEYITQYLNANKKTSGQFYCANLITTASADGYCTFPPIQLKANKTYTLVNVRTHFTNYKVGDTITTLDASDAGTANKTIQFTPESDGQLYVTGGDAVNVMAFDGTYSQTDYIYGKFDYRIKNESIGKQITENNCTFFKDCEQLLKLSEVTVGRYWNIWQGKVDYYTNANTTQYARIPLKAGETYTFINVYGQFTWIANADATPITALSTDANPIMTLEYTPTVDCYAYVSKRNTATDVMVINSNEYFPTEYVEGVYKTVLDLDASDTEKNISVKKNGGGNYTSVVDAVNFANQQLGKAPINIYIYNGDYDILEELGGQDFIDTIESSTNERQGLVLLRDNVNLIGVGHVVLRYEMPDTVTYNQASRTSCLNLREFSNRIENLTLIAKNCRYAIHDETNGGNPHITRVMKNIRAIHKGNASELWPYPTVLGGGAGGGSDYTFIDCQFITNNHNMAWSYHTNYNEEPSFFNVDGCVGIVNDSNGYSFRMSYHGTGRTGITVGNIKCCSGNGRTIVTAESSGDTDNNIEMYVNGYETISQIVVSGNE